MSFWRAMDARGGDCDGQAMNVANSLPVILSRAASCAPKRFGGGATAKEPRKHIVTVPSFHTRLTADARSLSVLWRIGMTSALSAR